MQADFVFTITVLILSVVIHEVSHGYAAQMLGDPTARLAGRLTLNPLKHLDPFGSVILPALLVFSGANFLIGWAKPVPYNPYNLRNGRYGEAFVAGAGPAINILIAVIFGLLMRFSDALGITSPKFLELAGFVVFINILLAIFNLIPVPPLDGSKVLSSLLPLGAANWYAEFSGFMEKYGMMTSILFIVVFFSLVWRPFFYLIKFVFTLITGMEFF